MLVSVCVPDWMVESTPYMYELYWSMKSYI